MEKKVMFTAVANTGGNIGPKSGDTTLVFNREITNIGNAYDQTSGIFKAPVAGYYYFSFFYHAGKTQKSGLTLMKNNTAIIRAFDDHQQGSDYTDNGANAACLKLQAGDEVSVCLPANCHVLGSSECTSFSGFLISEI